MILRKTQAEISLDNIDHNLTAFKKTLSPSVKVATVIKANGYGHDLGAMAELFYSHDVDYIATATLQEAAYVRRLLKDAPLMVMGYTPDDHLEFAVENGITLTVFSLAQCQLISQSAQKAQKTAKVHIKLDTGFNRLGYKDYNLAHREVLEASKLKNLGIEGIFSHLTLENAQEDEAQYKLLTGFTQELADKGLNIPIQHICDSIGAVAYPQYHMDMVRMGALLYGYCSRPTSFELKPAMALISEVSMVKTIKKGEGISYSGLFKAEADMKIATLPLGYADGPPRNIYHKGHVLVNGKKAPYAGLPCMDQCMIDVTDIPDVKVGDEVVLFGTSSKTGHTLPLDDLSKWCGTNKNELLTRVTSRVPRVFIRGGQVEKILDYME